MPPFNWKRTLGALVVGAVLIGMWFILETTVPLNAITRGETVIATPPDVAIVAVTFLMLIGVVLVSIQLAAVFEELLKTQSEK